MFTLVGKRKLDSETTLSYLIFFMTEKHYNVPLIIYIQDQSSRPRVGGKN